VNPLLAPTPQQWEQHAEDFVYWVVRICCGVRKNGQWDALPDPGTRAALADGLRRPPERFPQAAVRCVLGVTQEHGPEPAKTAWRSGDERLLTPAREYAYYTVAALIAAQGRGARDRQADAGRDEPRQSLGASLAQLDTGLDYDKESPRESDLRLMAKQGLRGIHDVIPDVVRQLRARTDPIPVDWARLISELSDWPQRRELITKGWNEDYYRTRYRNKAADQKEDDH
jgi:CRISPR system Cascade subunit CasB